METLSGDIQSDEVTDYKWQTNTISVGKFLKVADTIKALKKYSFCLCINSKALIYRVSMPSHFYYGFVSFGKEFVSF